MTVDPISEGIAHLAAVRQQIIRSYADLLADGQLDDALRAQYRCPQGCALIHLFEWEGQVAYLLPPYSLAPGANADRSNESGRQRNTTNGDNRWKARAGLFEQARAFHFTVNCKHTVGVPVDFAALSVGRAGRPIRGRIDLKSGEIRVGYR